MKSFHFFHSPGQYWIEMVKASTLVLLPVSEEMIQSFTTKCDHIYAFSIEAIYQV